MAGDRGHQFAAVAGDGQYVVIDGAGAAARPSLGPGGAQPGEGVLAGSEPVRAGGQRVAPRPGAWWC